MSNDEVASGSSKVHETNNEEKEANKPSIIKYKPNNNKNNSRFDQRIHSEPMTERKSRFEYRLTSMAIAESIYSGKSAISKNDASEMRQEYLNIINNKQLSFIQMKNKIYFELIDPVYSILGAKPQQIGFKFVLFDRNKKKIRNYSKKNRMISLGRRTENDIVLCSDSVRQISRVQAYIFVVNNKIIIYDMWSVCGTQMIQRSNSQKQSISTLPKNRNILIVDMNESFHLNMVSTEIHLLVNPETALKNEYKLFQIHKDMKNIRSKKQNKKKELNAKQKEFKNWICNEMGLEEYYCILIENGFDDMEVVSMLNDEDLENIGIKKKGSRMKMLLYFKKQKTTSKNIAAVTCENEGQ